MLRSFIVFLVFLISVTANASEAYSHNPVISNYKILPGDVLQISVWGEEDLDHEVLVLADGTLSFPLIDIIHAKNMTLNELEKTIELGLETIIPDAEVSASVLSPSGQTINVIGEVQKPGSLILSNRMNVLQALSQAGGLTAFADKNDIIILRTSDTGKQVKIDYPYADIIRGRKLDRNIELQPGDVVVVPE
jgi:polysaccharide export outer membrane protein